MELKKSNEANIEKLRVPITLLGLLFVMSVVLASFSYTTKEKRDDKGKVAVGNTLNDYAPEEQEDKPEPPPEEPTVVATPPPTDQSVQKKNEDKPPPPDVPVPPPVKVAKKEVITQPDEIIEFPDVEASFPGGAPAMQKWIADNVQYPQTSMELGDQGRVYLSFVVEPDGSISNIAIERGVTPELDREAKRLLRRMPKWNTGESKGRPVRARCRLPINFMIN